jgi:AraC-like DNA-binding protein
MRPNAHSSVQRERIGVLRRSLPDLASGRALGRAAESPENDTLRCPPWTVAAGISALGSFRGTTPCLLTSPHPRCIREVSILCSMIGGAALSCRRETRATLPRRSDAGRRSGLPERGSARGANTYAARFTDPRIQAAIRSVGDALETGVRVDDLAARLGLSRSRFEHLFKMQTGTTFRRYVRRTRLARAKALLQDPRLRVKEVASRCGYANTSSLTRAFERECGISPSDYRRSTSG